MGITVVLEDETGTSLATVEDPANVLHRLLPESKQSAHVQMLGFVDWYGDTVFNHLQADQFLREWDALAAGVNGSEERRVFDGIRTLVERLRGEHHVYLKFYGD
jgi:hypothetical protein